MIKPAPKTNTSACLALSIAGLLAGAAGVSAETLNPISDTWLQNGSTANNSADTTLRVKNQNNQLNDRVTFLRFDGSGLLGGNVDSATLSLTVTAFSSPTTMNLQLFGISNGALNESFDDTTLTFANSGYTDQSVDNNVNDTLFYGGVPLASFTLANSSPVGSVVSFSGSGLVDFLNANDNGDVTFVLTTATLADSVFLSFGSRENLTAANVPVLSYTAVPEPSSLAFLLGGLGLMALRFRRS